MPRSPRASTRATYSPETRAAAVAALLAGQSVSAVAREYQLPKGTVSAWRQRAASKVADDATQKAADPGQPTIGDLLTTLVTENIKGLIAASAVMQDAEWVRRQGAAELGTFLGITHDKVVRMLEAMDRSGEPAQPPSAS